MTTLLDRLNSERKTYLIKDMGRVVTGKTPSKDNPQDWGNEVDFITPTDFSSDEKYLSNIKRRISSEGADRYKNMIVPPESLIVTCIGSDMGKVVVSRNKALTNQQINSIIVDRNSFDLNFAYYTMMAMYPTLRSIAEEGGSTMPIITKSVFENIEFEAPNLLTQKKIAEVLTAYDAKVENNNFIINKLETMVQVLFDKITKFLQTDSGEIPQGWSLKKLDEIADVLFGYTFKSDLFNTNGEGVKVVRIRDVLSGTTETFSPENVEEKYRIQPGDLLIGMDGIFHMSMWFSNDCYLNQRVARIKSEVPTYFILQSIRTQLDFLQKTIIGATVGHLANGDIRGFKILLPEDKKSLIPFRDITEKILEIKKENVVLNELRDQLLAKLI